jgi:hypothetical protein
MRGCLFPNSPAGVLLSVVVAHAAIVQVGFPHGTLRLGCALDLSNKHSTPGRLFPSARTSVLLDVACATLEAEGDTGGPPVRYLAEPLPPQLNKARQAAARITR